MVISKMKIPFIILISMFSTQGLSEEHSLIGTWKSDEQKTLAYMHSVEGITKEAMGLFFEKKEKKKKRKRKKEKGVSTLN